MKTSQNTNFPDCATSCGAMGESQEALPIKMTKPKLHYGSSKKNNRRNRTMPDLPSRLPIQRTLIECFALYAFRTSVELIFQWLGPVKQGFFCNDLSIQFVKDGSIVNRLELHAFIYCCGFFPILFVELYRLIKFDPEICYSIWERGYDKMSRLAIRITIFYGYFQLAIVLTSVLTTVTKFSTGRLRPYFLDACKPDVDISSCYNTPKYFPSASYNCTGNDADVLKARVSFFSGHAAMSLASATFAVLYLQARFPPNHLSRLITPFLQMICFASGLFIAYSRVVDHSHHPTDVLGGIFVGITISTLVAKYVAQLFDPSTEMATLWRSSKSDETHATKVV